ncbi:potassium-transporting ATPase subunit F [Parachlamydia sp. AcF125]|nr:potassium-transporting ATPase subunit F [Parachlamydia sp. AcF125]MBS4167667.1 hypothetical protein [Parachlamydia sp. AcF125]
MPTHFIFAGIIVMLLLVYLIYTVLHPEKF